MLHIILLILKIIGIIIAILLGIVLLGLTAVLFVPVRYQAEVSRREGDMPILVKVKTTFLLHLLNVRVHYPAEPKPIVRVRIACFTIFQYPGKKKKNTATRNTIGKKKEKEKNAERKKAFPEEQSAEKNKEIESLVKPESVGKQTPIETVKNATESLKTETTAQAEGAIQPDAAAPQKKQSRVKQIWRIWKGLFQKLKKAFENIQYTITKVCDKIKNISDNIQYYHEVIATDTFQQSYAACKEQAGYLFRKIKPDTFRAELIIGTDDPATTAQILAVHGMLYPLLGNCIALQGDFEQQRIEGQVLLKGKIRVFTFLRVFIKIYFNKEIKKLIRLLKKEAA